MSSSSLSVGLNKGYPVTKRVSKARPSQMKGRLSARTKMIRSLVTEVCGYSPYERRMMDMLKSFGASADKRMYKFAKRRLGTHKRAVVKRELVKDAYAADKRAKAA
jgi:large subunit ribosomal protein L36e